MKIKNFTVYVAAFLLILGNPFMYASDVSVSDEVITFADQQVGQAQEAIEQESQEVRVELQAQEAMQQEAQESEKEVTIFADQQISQVQEVQAQESIEQEAQELQDSEKEAVAQQEAQEATHTQELDNADVDDYDYDYNQLCDNYEMDSVGCQESSYCRDYFIDWASRLVMFFFSAKNYAQEKYTSLTNKIAFYVYAKNKKLLDEPR